MRVQVQGRRSDQVPLRGQAHVGEGLHWVPTGFTEGLSGPPRPSSVSVGLACYAEEEDRNYLRHSFPSSSDSKEFACSAGDPGFDPWVGKIPWRMAWQPTPIFLPGESHGQRSLMDYSPLGHKGSDATEHACMHVHSESESARCSVVSDSACDPVDYTVRGILQARILEWVAFLFSRGSSQPK